MLHILGLKTEEKCFSDIQIQVITIIGKTAIWTILSFWVSAPDYINWKLMFVMQQPHVQ